MKTEIERNSFSKMIIKMFDFVLALQFISKTLNIGFTGNNVGVDIKVVRAKYVILTEKTMSIFLAYRSSIALQNNPDCYDTRE